MTQAATFGRRPGPSAAAPAAAKAASWPAKTVLAPIAAPFPTLSAPALSAYDAAVSARAFASADEELHEWKSERRTRLWEALGPSRWVGLASGAGALALWLTRADPGHLAGVLASVSALSWMAAGRRYRSHLRLKAQVGQFL